ncbi:gas vesicle protein G [Nocardia sp. CY41]|uniref:gas vesicle protein G n=1 Tax=Nocardia sp. CY41 TaxID=2608686 RepID=UPI001F455B15|nr:gas vesicle protein G [Nocardia sp. CY41]
MLVGCRGGYPQPRQGPAVGVIGAVVASPLSVVIGVIRCAQAIRDQAEQKTRPDPAVIRGQLEQIAEAAAVGELSQQQKLAAQQQVFLRMQRYPL